MKNRLLPLLTIILLLMPVIIINADSLSIGGYIENNTQIKFSNGRLFLNSTDLTLKLEGSTDFYHYYSELGIKYKGEQRVTDINGLFDLNTVTPVELNLKEAYIDLYGFPLSSIDLRIGKQIIVWGTADKINPTSNICPADLSNILDFGNKLGITAIQTNLYIGSATITGVYIPSFTPALLPSELFEIEGQATIDTPGQKLGLTSQAALQFNIPVSTFDLYANYYYGRYSIPSTYEVTTDYVTQDIESMKFFYPRLQVIGFSFSGSIFDLGIWGEAGYFIPENYSLTTVINNVPLYGTITQKDRDVDDPYIRYVIGSDYTFKGGLYLNVQFVHGFDNEVTKDSLNDYLIGRIEKSFFNDKLKISPLTFVLTTGDTNNIKNNYGVGYMPEIYYYPVDNIELDIGAYILDGKGDNLVSSMEKNDLLFIKAKVDF